jgi:hypothetical protein
MVASRMSAIAGRPDRIGGDLPLEADPLPEGTLSLLGARSGRVRHAGHPSKAT